MLDITNKIKKAPKFKIKPQDQKSKKQFYKNSWVKGEIQSRLQNFYKKMLIAMWHFPVELSNMMARHTCGAPASLKCVTSTEINLKT